MASNYQQYNPQGDVGQPQYAQQPMGQQQLQPQPPALPRSISTTNLDTTRRCRSVVQQDWVGQAPPGGTNFFSTLPAFTLTLPTLEAYPKDFQEFVFGRLIDKETQRYLEGEKCLNWCPSATQLVPLYTTGDGNCLLHAASLSMWGFQDRDFTLRRAVYTALQYHKGTHLYRRWKYCRETENRQTGLELEPQQWDYEWQVVVSQAATNAPQGQSLDSLDDFHVFVLANILRRPIIMYAAPKLRSQATGSTLQHINFHGVYLPLMWDPHSCKKDPLPLAYSGGHFVSLVAIEYPRQYHHGAFVLPLADFYGQQFPVRYALHMEDRTALLMDYLDLIQVGGHGSPYITANNVICAKLSIPEAPAYLKPLIAGFIDACREAHVAVQPRSSPQFSQQQQQPKQQFDSRQPQPQYNQLGGQQLQGQLPQGPTQPGEQYYGNTASQNAPTADQNKTKCINHCGMYGDTDKFGMCSRCFQKQQHQQFQQPSQQGHLQQSYQPQPGNPQGQDRPNQPQANQFYGNVEAQNVASEEQDKVKCINDCGLFGEPKTFGLCSKCFEKEQQAASANEGAPPPNQQHGNLQPQPNYTNTGMQGDGSLTSGTIKCPHCANPGFPKFLGMCEACFNPGLPKKHDPIYETIPGVNQPPQPAATPAPAVPLPRDPDARSQCRTAGCEFFGTAQTLFYCSRCFEADMDRILKEEVDNPGGHQPATNRVPVQQQDHFQQQAPRPIQQHAQPHQAQPPFLQNAQGPPGGVEKEPPKCSKCKKFFASGEYQGLCHGCFLEQTKTDTQGDTRNHFDNPQHHQTAPQQYNPAPVYEACKTRGCPNMASPGEYCTDCGHIRQEQASHQMTAPQPYSPQHAKCMNTGCNGPPTGNGFCNNCNIGQFRPYAATQQHQPSAYSQPTGSRPVPKPRKKVPQRRDISTAPIANLSNAMNDMTMSENSGQCFLCTGQGGTGRTNIVCQHHAEKMRREITDVKSKPQPPSNQHLHQVSQGQVNHPGLQGYQQPQSMARQSRGQFGNQAHPPQGGVSQSHVVLDQQVHPTPQGTVPQASGSYVAANQQMQAHQSQHGHLNPPYSSNSQMSTQTRGDAPPFQRNSFDTDNRFGSQTHSQQGRVNPAPNRQFNPAPQRGGIHDPQVNQFSNEGNTGHSSRGRFGEDLSSAGTHRQIGAAEQARGQSVHPKPQQTHAYEAHQPPPSQYARTVSPNPNKKKFGVNIEESAAQATAPGSGSPGEVTKQLCRTAGCSFKGYCDLEGLCPDCYEQAHPGQKAPEHLPLV